MYQDYWNGVAQRPAQSTMRRTPQRRPQMAGGMLGGHAYGDDGLLPPGAPMPPQILANVNSQRPKVISPVNFGLSGAATPSQGQWSGQPGWQGIARPTGQLPPGAIRLPDGRIGYPKRSNQVPTGNNIQQMLTDIASGGGDINSLLQALLFQQVSPQQMGNRGVASGSWGGY